MRSDETKTVIYELIFEGVDYAALRALVTFKKNGKKSEHLAVLPGNEVRIGLRRRLNV